MLLPQSRVDLAVSCQVRGGKPGAVDGGRGAEGADVANKRVVAVTAPPSARAAQLRGHNVQEDDHAFADVEEDTGGVGAPVMEEAVS